MSELLHMSVGFDKRPEGLAVSYTVSNEHPETVYLTNHAVSITRGVGPVPDRNLAFVAFEDGTVHITKRKPKPPQGFFTPRQHFVSEVPPHGSFTETFVVPIPIKECVPYSLVPPDSEFTNHILNQVKFSLGYVVGGPHLTTVRTQVAGIEVLALAPSEPPPGASAAPPLERFVTSELVNLSVNVATPTLAPENR